MALAHAILAAIAGGESSGYDLAKSFDVARRLHQARAVRQQKRSDKRLFSLTRSGRDLLHEFSAAAPKPTAIRDELLVQLEAMGGGFTPRA